MSNESPKAGFFRSKLFWGLCALPVFVIGVLIAFYLLGRETLSSKLTEMRENGLPTNLSELNEYYAVPEGVTDRTKSWQKAIDLLEKSELGKNGEALPFLGNGNTPIPPPGEEWDQYEASQQFLAEREHILEAIYDASSESGQLRFPLDFNAGNPLLLTMTEQPRTAARLLTLDAHTSMHQKSFERTLKDLLSIFELSNAMRGEVILVNHLIHIAIQSNGISALQDLIIHNDWTDEQLATLQMVIREANFRAELIHCLHGECASSLDMMDQIPLGPFRAANKMELIRLMESTVTELENSWRAGIEWQKTLSAEMTAKRGSAMTMLRLRAVFLLAPAYEQIVLSGAEATARQRCANAALAAKRHQLRHGILPVSLEEIDKDLIGPDDEVDSLLTDPFDGKPLQWLSEETRVVVFSIGKDLKGDGGDIESTEEDFPTDVGFSIRK